MTPEKIGAEFQINTYTDSDQYFPSVTSLRDGGFVVTWTSRGQDGMYRGIFGQRYTASGQASGNEFQINTYTTSDQEAPSVTSLSDGGFVVTWMSYEQDGSGYGVFGQRYTASGQASGNEFQINTYTSNAQYNPSVASLSDGGFVVTWMSFQQDGSEYGIYGQRYTASGQASGNEFQINTYTDSYPECEPSVTSFSDGGFVVTWRGYRQDGSEYGIYGQRYTASGEASGDEFQINTSGNHLRDQNVASLSDGGFVVTWADELAGLNGQLYTASGETSGNEFQIVTSSIFARNSSVASLSDGGFVVTWQNHGQDHSLDDGIYGQRYTASAQAYGNEFQINTYTTDGQTHPSVTSLSDGGFVVTWMSDGQDGSGHGIFAQMFSTEPQANTNTPPTYQEPDDFEYETGASLTISLDNIFSDADGDTLTYTVTNLPAGLTYNSVSKQIEGTLTADAGVYSFNVMADDGNGGSVSASFDLTVLDETEVPVPTVSVSVEEDAAEPNSEGKFTLSLNQASSEDIVLDLSISGSASQDKDYYILVTSGSTSSEPGSDHSTLSYTTTSTSSLEVGIPAGATEATIHIVPLDDTSYEGSETVVATLNSVISGEATISSENASATMVIADDDAAPPTSPDFDKLALETTGTWSLSGDAWVLSSDAITYIGHGESADSTMLKLVGGEISIEDGQLKVRGASVFSDMEGKDASETLFTGDFDLNLSTLVASQFEDTNGADDHRWAGFLSYSAYGMTLRSDGVYLDTAFGSNDYFNPAKYMGKQDLVLTSASYAYADESVGLVAPDQDLFGDKFSWGSGDVTYAEAADLSLQINEETDRVELRGAFALNTPEILGVSAGLSVDVSGDKYFSMGWGDQGFEWDLVASATLDVEAGGDADAPNVDVSASLDIDTTIDYFGGSLGLQLPFLTSVYFAAEVHGGWNPFEINSVGLAASGLNIPLDGLLPGLTMTGIGATVENMNTDEDIRVIASPDAPIHDIDGGIYFEISKSVATVGEGSLTGEFSSGYISGRMNLGLTGASLLSGAPKIGETLDKWFGISEEDLESFNLYEFDGGITYTNEDGLSQLALDADLSLFSQESAGGLNFSGDLILNSEGDLSAMVEASLKIPDFFPRFLRGYEIGATGVLEFSNNGVYSDDYVAMWLTLGGITDNNYLGLKVAFDGTFTRLGYQRTVEIIENLPFADSQTQQFTTANSVVTDAVGVTLDTSLASLMISVTWESESSDAEFVLTHPDGTVIIEAEFGSYGNVEVVADLSDTTSRTLVLKQPATGQWTVQMVSGASLGAVTYEAYEGDAFAELSITGTSFDEDARSLTVDSALTGANAGEIAYFLDTDQAGFDGVRLNESTVVDGDGTTKQVLDLSSVGKGTFYIYARYTSENDAPVYAYASDALTIATESDLGLTLGQGQHSDSENHVLTFRATNDGTRAAQNLSLTIAAPAGLVIDTSQTSDYTIDDDGRITFALASLGAGAYADFTLAFVDQATLDGKNLTANLTSESFDASLGNDTITYQFADETSRKNNEPTGPTDFADILQGGSGNDRFEGGKGKDILRGSDGDDTLIGGEDDDQLFGEGDDDVLDGGAGSDQIYGGDGIDTYLFHGTSETLVVEHLSENTYRIGESEDTTSSISAIIEFSDADTVSEWDYLYNVEQVEVEGETIDLSQFDIEDSSSSSSSPDEGGDGGDSSGGDVLGLLVIGAVFYFGFLG